MEEDSASSSELALDDIPAEAAQQIVTAIRQYMFERNGRWQWRDLSGADFIEFVTLLLSQHDLVTRRASDPGRPSPWAGSQQGGQMSTWQGFKTPL